MSLQSRDAPTVAIGLSREWSVVPVPKYDYKCPMCNMTWELELSMDHDLVKCPDCKTQANRIFSAPGVVFKGKGFYSTGG